MEKGKKKENRNTPYRIKTVSQWRHYGCGKVGICRYLILKAA